MSTPDSEQRALLLIIAATLTLLLNGCTTAYFPNGKKAVTSGADFQSLTFKSGNTSLTILGHRPSSNVRAAGSVAGTVLTGAVGLRIPVP